MSGARRPWIRLSLTHNGEPTVDQGRINDWYMSWNPDDNRFYVSHNDFGIAAARFKRWSNAVYYARTHTHKEMSE